jgi:hypothetical protein
MKRLPLSQSLVFLLLGLGLCAADQPAESKNAPADSATSKTACCFNHPEPRCKKCNRRLALCRCRNNWQLVCEWLSYRPGWTESFCKDFPSGCHPPLYLYFLNNCSGANGCGAAGAACAGGNCHNDPLASTAGPTRPLAHVKAPNLAKTSGGKSDKSEAPTAGTALVTWQEEAGPAPQSSDKKCSACWLNRLDVLGLLGSRSCPGDSRPSSSSVDTH